MKKLFVLIGIVLLSACTDNQRARNFGGTETVTLKKNEEFINITWKGDDMWIIVRDTITGNFYAREKSSYGMLEGTIYIQKYKGQ